MVSQLEVHLVGKSLEQHILDIGRKFAEYQVARGLERTPDRFERAGIEGGKGHEVLRYQLLLRVDEVTLGVLVFRLFHTFAEHLVCFQAGNGVFLRHVGHQIDQALLHELIARSGFGKDSVEYLTVVIRILDSYSHIALLFI